MNSGTWYEVAYNKCINVAGKDFSCPLILASDKTTLSKIGDLHVNAIFMTTSIFNYTGTLVQVDGKSLLLDKAVLDKTRYKNIPYIFKKLLIY